MTGKPLLLSVALTLASASCAAPTPASETPGATGSAISGEPLPGATVAASGIPSPAITPAPPPEEPPIGRPTATGPSRASELGLAEIELLTPTEGRGRRPILEWSPLPGAVNYHVFVRAPSGRVYWGWRTSETSIPIGGLPRLTENAAGPAISVGMTWSVSAVGADGGVIALSGHRPIAP